MPVDRTDVADPERLEEAVRGDDLAKCDREPVRSRIGERAESGDLPQQLADALAGVDVRGAEPQVGQPRRQPRDRGRVRASVVVQDDDDAASGVAEVVERLVGHAAGERPVAEHRHDVPIGLAA